MEATAPSGLINQTLNQRDKQLLRDVSHRLLAHGSLMRRRSSEKALYDWASEHQEWLEEWASLLGLKIIIQRDERMIMAIPEFASMTRRLRRDETLLALALWYDYDIEVRENGAHDVFFSIREFNEALNSKFPSIQALSASRLREILRSFARFNMVEVDWQDEFSDSVIQILPTLRFAIPFPDIEEWLKIADTFSDEDESDEEDKDSDLESSELSQQNSVDPSSTDNETTDSDTSNSDDSQSEKSNIDAADSDLQD